MLHTPMQLLLAFVFVLISSFALTMSASANENIFNGGHAKYLFLLNTFPDDSLFLDYVDSPTIDQYGDLRLKFNWQKDKVQIAADYQLIAGHGDGLTLANSLPGDVLIPNRVPTDEFRLFDLTDRKSVV